MDSKEEFKVNEIVNEKTINNNNIFGEVQQNNQTNTNNTTKTITNGTNNSKNIKNNTIEAWFDKINNKNNNKKIKTIN